MSMKKFKDKKGPPPSTIPPNKTKIFWVESEILIKYKRIKWTPRVKALQLSSQGDNLRTQNKILIKYKRIKWTPSRKVLHLLPGG